MNELNTDSKISTPISSASKASFSPRFRKWAGVFVFILGLCSGVLLTQFQTATGSLSIEAGLRALTDKAADLGIQSSIVSELWQYVHSDYVDSIDDREMFYGALEGLVAGVGDPYSVFFPPAEAQEFLSDIEGKFEGIGAEIGKKNDELTIISPLPGSPAEAKGVLAGDVILTVDEKDVRDLSVTEVVNLIRGEKGTEVTLLLKREGAPQPLKIIIVRDTIQIQSVTSKMLPDTQIGYIQLSSFSTDTVSAFKQAASDILLQNPQGLILDVRNNPGGYLEGAVDIAGVFLDLGVVVLYEQYGDGNETSYVTKAAPVFGRLPVVVLLNEGSASAAEILAGALKDHERATLIGETTFGKGSVQTIKRFSDGSLLKLTIAHWLTPHKITIQEKGIVPDYRVERAVEEYAEGKDSQLDAARLFLTDRETFDTQYTATTE